MTTQAMRGGEELRQRPDRQPGDSVLSGYVDCGLAVY